MDDHAGSTVPDKTFIGLAAGGQVLLSCELRNVRGATRFQGIYSWADERIR